MGTRRTEAAPKLKVVVENFQFLNRAQPGAYGGGAGAAPGADAEYSGEDSAPAPRQVAAPAARQPFRSQGRPAAQPARPAATPNYDVGDVPSVPEDEGVNIKGEDIPF